MSPRGGCLPDAIARGVASFVRRPRGSDSKQRGFSSAQGADLELRSVAGILAVATRRGLFEGRAAAPKAGGPCRDFAIPAASALRERDIPARLRVGFADHPVPEFWEDRWLCKWRDGIRWRHFDVEVAAAGGTSFDGLDAPRERFLTASEAWFRIRAEPEIARRFGVSSQKLHGECFVACSLFRDLAALCKMELKPWEYWGLAESLSREPAEWAPFTRTILDETAAPCAATDAKRLPAAVANRPLPKQVVSFPKGEPVLVEAYS